VELLTDLSVVDYLIAKAVISSREAVHVEILTGGVSNTVLGITTNTISWVLKQALPELKVAEKWEADQRRAIVEADALRLFHTLSPKLVPELVFIDPERFVLIMERVPLESTVWKADLLNGIFYPEVARELGKTLAEWHLFGAENPKYQAQFMEDSLFEQLRVDPFYRFVSARNPPLQTSISRLIDELESDHSTIVHGDFSPKNIMIDSNHHIYILDFEVMHVGNPVFDLAFIMAHLLCKFFHAPNADEAAELSNIAKTFLNAYLEHNQIAPTLVLHTALITLARVEGKSPVNYLSQSEQEKIQLLTKKVLLDQKTEDVMTLFDVSQR